MNKLNKIYEELQLIEEFESNFNITKESKERREYLLKIINKKNMKKFLCIEAGEKFIIRAKDVEEAREKAIIFCAEVRKEVK